MVTRVGLRPQGWLWWLHLRDDAVGVQLDLEWKELPKGNGMLVSQLI